MKNRRHLIIGCLAAIAVALSACGSGAGESAATDTSATSTVAVAADSVRPPPPTTPPDETAPAVTEPDTSEPATTEPATTEPATTQPETTVPATTLAPPIVAGFAQLALTEPAADAASTTPLFGWQPVDGAATYRLVVIGPAGPIWAWEGGATSVRLGGLAGERPAGFGGPVIVDGSSWSVVALDVAGQLVAVSELRSIGAA